MSFIEVVEHELTSFLRRHVQTLSDLRFNNARFLSIVDERHCWIELLKELQKYLKLKYALSQEVYVGNAARQPRQAT